MLPGKEVRENRIGNPDWVKLCVELNYTPNQTTIIPSATDVHEFTVIVIWDNQIVCVKIIFIILMHSSSGYWLIWYCRMKFNMSLVTIADKFVILLDEKTKSFLIPFCFQLYHEKCLFISPPPGSQIYSSWISTVFQLSC